MIDEFSPLIGIILTLNQAHKKLSIDSHQGKIQL
jgi:hypothetical protein